MTMPVLPRQVADKEAGANCSASTFAVAAAASKRSPPKPRFRPGGVDEVSQSFARNANSSAQRRARAI